MVAIPPSLPNLPNLSFGPFELNPASGELRKSGVLVKLQPQPFRLLLFLAERSGTVVTREEIQRCLWSESTFVDFEHGINFSINQIRGALADDAEKPRFIETLPRRGYRFIAPVHSSSNGHNVSRIAVAIPITQNQSASPAEFTASREVTGVTTETGRPRWTQWAAAAASILLIGSAFLWYARRHPPPAPVLEPNFRQLTVNSPDNPVNSGAISPDGKYLAFSDTMGMHVKLIATDETHSVAAPEGGNSNDVVWEIPSSAWFPDSARFVANAHPARETRDDWSSSSSSVWVVSILGGAPRKLRDHAVSWSVSPDGSSVSFSAHKGDLGDRELWLIGPNAEQPRKLFEVGGPGGVCCLRFIPGAKSVYYLSTDESGDSLKTRDVESGREATLLPPAARKRIGDFLFLPDGRFLYSDPLQGLITGFDTPGNYWIERLNPQTGGLAEPARRLTNWAGRWISNSSVSADAKRVAFLKSSGRGSGYLADLDPGGTKITNSRRFTWEEGGEDALAGWTVDGKRAIVVRNRGDRYAIYKQTLNSDTLVPIVAPTIGGLNEDAVASPDGKWLILEIWPTTGGEQVQVLRVLLTGGTPELLFKVREGSGIACAKPPSTLCAVSEESDDRKQMIITSFDPARGRGSELARFDLRDQAYDIEQNMLRLDISPDGTRLTAALGPFGPIAIHSLPTHHTKLIQTENLNRIRLLRWAADGKGLIVSSFAEGGGQILHLDLTGKTTLLWKCHGDQDNCFGLPSPDGRHLAIYTWNLDSNMWMMENF
jgi:DNA-binding winged helix-turn-helix (wHTH) protein/Tol biopolymer transport system component